MKIVSIQDIAEDVGIDEKIIEKHFVELLNDQSFEKSRYSILDDGNGKAFVFDVEDINFINESEANDYTFIEIANNFRVNSSKMDFLLNQLNSKGLVNDSVLKYLVIDVKEKPGIRARFEPEIIHSKEEFSIFLEINTENEINELKINENFPIEIEPVFTPTLPETINSGRQVFRYQVLAEKYGTYNVIFNFEGIIRGNVFKENITLSDLRIRALEPDIVVEKIPENELDIVPARVVVPVVRPAVD